MLKPGDVVRLKSKPEQSMTVADVTDGYPGAPPLYECHWWVGEELHKRHFPEHELEHDGWRSGEETLDQLAARAGAPRRLRN
jgi:uncharacterized protein YodC (DUF2158 family)